MQSSLICRECKKEYVSSKPRWKCDCGGLLSIVRKLEEMEINGEIHSLWRYKDFLPIDREESIITLGEGMTPLVVRTIAGQRVLLKSEFISPTGSYKDRGAAVLLSKIKEWDVKHIVIDSSGNAGAAIAAYAAAAGVECEIYLPLHTSEGKVKQIQAYGAKVVKVPGERAAAYRAAINAAGSAFYASHYWNPLFFEGTKTIAYEIWEQLGYEAPDALVVPVGNGTLLLGVYAGFMDLLEMGQIPELPRLYAVQSENCAPIYSKFYQLTPQPLIPTIAEGISISEPVRGDEIIEAVKAMNGQVITVSDQDIISGIDELGKTGLYVEPTSGTVIAGFKQVVEKGWITPDQCVVLPLTGSGLKKG